MRVATYNIRRGLSWRGRPRFDRIIRTVRSISPDVLFLQEVDVNRSSSGDLDQPFLLGKECGLTSSFFGRMGVEGGRYGLAVLSRFPLSVLDEESLHVSRRGEKTILLHLAGQWDGREVQFLTTHVGHGFREREKAFERIRDAFKINRPVIVGGDLNTTTWSTLYRRVVSGVSSVGRVERCPTWPGFFPYFQIDHIFFSSDFRLVQARSWRSFPSSIASDHLPLVADFNWHET